MAKKKLNVKFLALVLGLLAIGGAVIGGFVLVQYRNDPVKHIRRGDQLLADGRPEEAMKQYGRGIGKAQYEMPYYDKAIAAVETITPQSESKSKEMFRRLLMLVAAKAEKASADSESGKTAKEVRDETIEVLLDEIQVYTFQVPRDDLQAKGNAYGSAAQIVESLNQSLLVLGPEEVAPRLKAAVRGVVVEPEWRTATGLDQQQWEDAVEKINAAIEIDAQYVPTQYGILRGTLDRFADKLVSTGRTGVTKALDGDVDPRLMTARASLSGELAPELTLLEFDRNYLLFLAGFAGDDAQALTAFPDLGQISLVRDGIKAILKRGMDGTMPRFEVNARLFEIRSTLMEMLGRRATSTIDDDRYLDILRELDSAFKIVSDAISEFDPEDLRNCTVQLALVAGEEDPMARIEAMIAIAKSKQTVGHDRLLRTSFVRNLQTQAFEIAYKNSKGTLEISDAARAELELARNLIEESYSDETVRERDFIWQRLEVLYNYRLALDAISEEDELTAKSYARKSNRATQLLESIMEEERRVADIQLIESAIGAAKIIGDFGTATQLFEAALSRQPSIRDDPGALIELASLYLESGRTAEAGRVVEKIRAMSGDDSFDARFSLRLSKIEAKIGTTEKGMTLADLAGSERLVADQKALAAGNTEERRRILGEIIENVSSHRAVRLQAVIRLAALEQAEGDTRLAQQFARQALEMDPDSMEAKMILAFDKSDTPVDRARAQSEMVYDDLQDIEVATAKSLMSSLQQFRGRYSPEELVEIKSAIAEIEANILASEERRLPAMELLLGRALRNQNFEEAKTLIDEIEPMLGGAGPSTIRMRASVMASEGELNDAIALLTSAIDDQGFGTDRLCILLGQYLARRGDREAALARFDQAFKQAPARSENAYALGEALIRAGKLNDALQVLRAARGSGRNSKEYRDLWLAIEGQAGNFDVAIRERRRLLEVDPFDATNSVALAQLLIESPIGRESVTEVDQSDGAGVAGGSAVYSVTEWAQLGRAERQALQIAVREERRVEAREVLSELVDVMPTDSTVVIGAHRFGFENPELKLETDLLQNAATKLRALISSETKEQNKRRLRQSLSLIIAEQGIDRFRLAQGMAGTELQEQAKAEADRLFEEASKLEGSDLSDTETVIANFLIMQDDLERAAVFQTRLLAELRASGEPDPVLQRVAGQLVRILIENEKLEEAEEVLARYFDAENIVAGANPLFGALEFAMAEVSRRKDGGSDGGGLSSTSLERLLKSEEYFNAALSIDAGNAEAVRQLARIARYRWKYAADEDEFRGDGSSESEQLLADAIRAAERLVAQNETAWSTRKILVDLHQSSGDTEAAILELRKLLEIAPRLPEPRFRLVVMLREAGLVEQALDVAQVALDRDPSNVRWARSIGLLRQELGQWDEAAELFGRLYEQTKTIGFLRSQVDALMSREDPAAAQVVNLVRENQREFGRDPMLIGSYCAALAATGRRSAALQQFEAAYRSTRDQDAVAKSGLARWLTSMYPKTKDGIEELTAFVDRISDGNPELIDLMQISATWNSLGEDPDVVLPKAVDVVERAITVGGATGDPGLLGAYMQLGILKSRQDDCAGATQAFEQVLDLRPGDAQILNNLAYLAVDCGGDLDVARSRAQTAVAAKPASAEFRDTLGVIYMAEAMAIGDSDPEARDLAGRKAEQELRQATKLSQNVSPWLHLSELLIFLDRPEEARRAVAKASDLDKDKRFQEKFNGLLEQIKDR